MEKFAHVIREEDLANHPEVFVEGAQVGSQVLLAANDMRLLGLSKHVVSEADVANNPDANVEVGVEVLVPDVEAFSTLEKEVQEAEANKEE